MACLSDVYLVLMRSAPVSIAYKRLALQLWVKKPRFLGGETEGERDAVC